MDIYRPSDVLGAFSAQLSLSVDSAAFAKHLDSVDPLSDFRQKFAYPKNKTLPIGREWPGDEGDKDCIYFCGNSLGLKPKKADVYMQDQLKAWADMGVFMHFEGELGAAVCDQPGKKFTAELVGADSQQEVVIMNGLTVNLHLMMQAFYKPTETRFKIMIEGHAFPSDRYAMQSLISLHGLNPDEALVQLEPRSGEHTLRTEDILQAIATHGHEVAVVALSGVQYYTGQRFDVERITRAGRAAGCVVGWDLAHSIGNVKLSLHQWDVDFAVWCTYKYLNSGAGGIAGAFVHSRWFQCMPAHLQGWWSNKMNTRFRMDEHVDLDVGADAFRLCNPPPWLACLNMASLEIFHEAGMNRIEQKQFLLTGFLEFLLRQRFSSSSQSTSARVEIITPEDPSQRGSQLSLVFSVDLSEVHGELERRGVVCDIRLPSVVRVAPAPLYNTFSEVRAFVDILEDTINAKAKAKP